MFTLFFSLYFKTVTGSADLRVLCSPKGRCAEWMQNVTLSEEPGGGFIKDISEDLTCSPSNRMAMALSENGCIHSVQTVCLAYIDSLCGSLVPFSKNQDAEPRPESYREVSSTDNDSVYLPIN